MPEKNCAYLSWVLEGPRRGWMGSCPVSRALLTNISPKARTGEKKLATQAPLCLLGPAPKSPEGRSCGTLLDEAKLRRRRDTLSFFFPGKEGSQPGSFLAHQAFLLLNFSSRDPASSPHSLFSSLPGKPPNSRRKLSKYL